MPNADLHKAAGALAGLCFSLYKSTDQKTFWEALGGSIGGYIGGQLPDIIDPPISPRHRSIGHGIAPIGTIAAWYFNQLDGWQEFWRNHAANAQTTQQEENNPFNQFRCYALGALYHFVAGILAGFGAGYVSHLAMDLFTPAGLPLLAKKYK